MGIDGRSFESPAAGIRRYVRGLVSALLALDEALDVLALGGTPSALPEGVGHVPARTVLPTNAGWTLAGIPLAASRAGVDVIHAPAYTAPFRAPAPVVVTVHDVSYERHPEWYPYRRDWLRRAFYRRSATSATRILTVSEFSATEIVAAYGVPRERIVVVPLGVDPAFEPSEEARWRGDGGYLLHVGDVHERRNLETAVDALLAARERAQSPLTLTLVGRDRGLVAGLRDRAARGGAPDAIAHLEDITDDRLRALYHGALALVYPSRYEGFGLPLLEAMACGTPVLASNAAAIPEVVGHAGILLDPADVAGWTEAILTLLVTPERRGALRDAGLRRVRGFTWARTARETLDVYRNVAGRAA